MKSEQNILRRSIKRPDYNLEISKELDISEKKTSLVRYEEYILKQLKEKQKKAN